MKSLQTFRISLYVLVAVVISAGSRSATINSADLSAAALQVAINLAVDGDVVKIPAGAATWETPVSFSNKSIAIIGAGQGITTITVGSGISNGQALTINNCGIKKVEVANMSWIGNLGVGGTISIGGNSETNTNFRFHHMTFQVNKRSIIIQGRNDGGLVDHCIFNCSLNSAVQGITIFGDAGFNLVPGNTTASFPAGSAWSRGLTIGTSQMVFVEDCTFNFDYVNDAAVEGYQGARFVVRYCSITNAQLGLHGLDSSITSAHSFEFYNNTWILPNDGHAKKVFAEIRGGSGVIFNNNTVATWIGTGPSFNGNIVNLNCYRATGYVLGASYQGGFITGNNPNDGNLSVTESNVGPVFAAATTGTHTGPNDTTTLADSTKSWAANEWSSPKNFSIRNVSSINGFTDLATTTTSATVTSAAALFSSSLEGCRVVITGGANFVPSTYIIYRYMSPTTFILDRNCTSGAGSGGVASVFGARGNIISNTVTTAVTTCNWRTGDQYVITWGWPGLQQVATTGPVTLGLSGSTSVTAPIYQWNNTLNGSAVASATTGLMSFGVGPSNDALLAAGGHVRPYATDVVKEGRDYFNNIQKPGYTPFTYPHPLGRPTGPSNLRISP